MVIRICLLGASLHTGNLGVSALASSCIQLLRNRWPECNINIIGGYKHTTELLLINDKEIIVDNFPVRYSLNIFKINHIVWIYIAIFLKKLLPFITFTKKNNTANTIINSDLVCDITGGDSFSDIYGIKRLVIGYLIKRACQLSGKPFIMLPQTYGPFNSSRAQKLAQIILLHADRIYSRDKEGLKTVEELVGKTDKTILCPDVAFTLQPKECKFPKGYPDSACQIIGINISGLLYNGGYTGNNEFNIKCNYKEILENIIKYFNSIENTYIMLVPHVVPKQFIVENDLEACSSLYNELPDLIKEKVFIAKPESGNFYDESEIKYLIGKCNFFLGSRMHSTIAAISQCVPTVGLAYSNKFAGVYETVGIKNCVLDMRSLSDDEIIKDCISIYETKDIIKNKLLKTIPIVKELVYSIFKDITI